jgi:hypothetical protein
MQASHIAVLALVIAILVAVAAAIGWIAHDRRRRQHLRTRFGSEYDRTVVQFGDRRRAESELARREHRVRNMKVRPLTVPERQKFRDEWLECQALFVDDPARAVDHADRLLTDVMRVRGYSTDNPYDRVADISAAYPRHAETYRRADEIATRQHRGQTATEDLRNAFIYYRALFDEILGGQDEELKRAS